MIAALERKNKRLAKTRAIMLEHDPEKHALGLDPRVGAGFPKRWFSEKDHAQSKCWSDN
jgi:hypothetical protein